MESLFVNFGELDTLMKVFWVCGIASTIVFVIQMVMTFIGVDAFDADFDFDTGAGDTLDLGGALSLFSIRNIVNFFLGFGWGGVCFSNYITNKLLLVFVALIVGLAFVVLFFFLVRQLLKLETNGTVNMADCVGKQCYVYLRIPAKGEGKGKVQISINGTIMEFDAVTNEAQMIPTGERATVLESLGGGVLLVSRAQ